MEELVIYLVREQRNCLGERMLLELVHRVHIGRDDHIVGVHLWDGQVAFLEQLVHEVQAVTVYCLDLLDAVTFSFARSHQPVDLCGARIH